MANSTLKDSVHLALTAGTLGALTPASMALAQQAGSAAPSPSLEEVTVTGSRVRRIEAETASPIFVLDQTAIAASGVQTLGDLVQRIPAVSGAAMNPQVNNGVHSGYGESNIELRGLNAKRTLILLNGRRVGLAGATGATDVNTIPVSLIDHVEVLKEGAGAVYGSDAIAGVVNFITRKNVDGFEVGADYGQTSQSDGQHYSTNLLWGASTDKFGVLVGGSYNQQKKVLAADREYSKYALYLYSGAVTKGGSSRIPTGRVYLPANANDPLRVQFNCKSLTRKTGAAGSSLSDYRCRTGADTFNYQPFNLLMTPQERAAAFTTLNYKFNEYVESYAEILFNRTHSGFQYAPLPFDATDDNTIISKDSIYNIFGYDFGGFNSPNPNLRVRLESLGNRFSSSTSDSKSVTLGARGKLGETGWQWDANLSYARLDQNQHVSGYFYIPGLQNAVGPSFYQDPVNKTGPTCGTPAAPIAGCIPLNLFNVQDPAQIASLAAVTTGYSTGHTFSTKGFALNFNGNLFQLPAGPAATAVGIEYRKLDGGDTADYLAVGRPPLYTNCLLSSETCTGNSQGGYSDKEIYAEVFFPLLKELPAVHALNATLGVRHSDYDLFGSTTKGEFKVEYRPVADLLLRGTFSQVFRVPTIVDVYGEPNVQNPTFADPCYKLTAAKVASSPLHYAAACVNVPLDGSYTYPGTAQITSVIESNLSVKPETGHVVTFGFVYDSSLIQGLQISADAWRYDINNLITNVDTNYTIGQCLNNGTPYFCDLVTRLAGGPSAGGIAAVIQPTINLGELKTNGIDIGVKYALRNTGIGSFQFGLDLTRTQKYQSILTGAPPKDYVGLYDRQFGNIAKMRGTFTVGWAYEGFSALLAVHYVDKVTVPNADGASPFDSPSLPIPAIKYLDLSGGYLFASKTKLLIGITNLANKLPPIFFQNNVLNANTDVNTYDTLGRRFFVSVNQKF